MNSVDKYGSDCVPFTGRVFEPAPAEQQLREIFDALVPEFEKILDALVPAIESCVKAINEIWDEILKQYPDKRVVWLAFYHPKERVRKKNRNRIVRHILRTVNADEVI